jgi:drug/metabolite transporter (DMT)-like permease
MGFSNPSYLPTCADWRSGWSSGIKDTLIGFGLVLFASVGISAALNIQKVVHVRNQDPITGEPRANFTRMPLWWVGMLLNSVSELVNLAALGFAPATLVTPLGCITVGINSVTSVVWLGEPFLKRDLLGVVLLTAGVACVVMSQVGAPVQPITPHYLITQVFRSPLFWAYVALVACGLLVLCCCVERRYARRYSWVYLGESALVGSVSTVAARAFASMVMPGVGSLSNLLGRDSWTAWGALLLLIAGAVASLVLQNRAMMHFGNSEVVPIYFCLFTVGGVTGAAMAYEELCWPWVWLFLPGLCLCMLGVFAIACRRQGRLAARLMLTADQPAGGAQPEARESISGESTRSSAWRDSSLSCASISACDSMLTLGGGSLASTTFFIVTSKQPATLGSDALLDSPAVAPTPTRTTR